MRKSACARSPPRDRGTGSIEVTRMNATDEEALRSLRVADVIRRDVPRVSALASAADAAREACDYAT